jgi:hypothetical protein
VAGGANEHRGHNPDRGAAVRNGRLHEKGPLAGCYRRNWNSTRGSTVDVALSRATAGLGGAV